MFVGWWFLTFVRSVLFSDIPPLQAALFGRDFLYFGLLCRLARRLPPSQRSRGARRNGRVGGNDFRLWSDSHVTVPPVSAVFDPTLLINENFTNEFEGVTRVYSYMGDVVVLGAIMAGGVAMSLARGMASLAPSLRDPDDCALTQLSRAAYAALLAGFLVVVCCAPAGFRPARGRSPRDPSICARRGALSGPLARSSELRPALRSAAQVFATRRVGDRGIPSTQRDIRLSVRCPVAHARPGRQSMADRARLLAPGFSLRREPSTGDDSEQRRWSPERGHDDRGDRHGSALPPRPRDDRVSGQATTGASTTGMASFSGPQGGSSVSWSPPSRS